MFYCILLRIRFGGPPAHLRTPFSGPGVDPQGPFPSPTRPQEALASTRARGGVCRVQPLSRLSYKGPKPYKFIGFGDIHGPKPYKIHRVW